MRLTKQVSTCDSTVALYTKSGNSFKKRDNSNKVNVHVNKKNKKFINRCHSCGQIGHKKQDCRGCYSCGSKDHFKKNCPNKSEETELSKMAGSDKQTSTGRQAFVGSSNGFVDDY